MPKSFAFEFDLDFNMRPTSGTLTFEEGGRIVSAVGGDVLREVDAKDIEEAVASAEVGSGLIFVRLKDGNDVLLCRFTLSAMKAAGEFCKVVNYFCQTGVWTAPEAEIKQYCDRCGRAFLPGVNTCLFCYDKMGVLRRAFELMRPFAKKIMLAEILLTVSSILYLLVPIINRILIDRHLKPMTGTAFQVITLALLMLLARAAGEVVYILGSRVFNKNCIHYANHIRNLAYEKIQKLSLGSLSRRTSGDLINRVMEDTTTIKDFISDGGRWAVEQVLIFIIVLTIMLFTNAKLTVIVFLPVPLVMFVVSRFWRTINIRYSRQWHKNSKCRSILHDIIRGIRTVKSFGKEEDEIRKFAKANYELAEISSDNEALWARLFPLMTFFIGIGEFLVLYFGGRAILQDEMSLGLLVQFTMYIGYVYAPLRWLVSFPRWLGEAMTSMVKVFEIIDEEPEIIAVENPKNVSVTGGISFEGVSFGYKSYEPVLKDINLDIKPGEMVGIVGRSGAGKSTMVNLVLRLYDPGKGRICINGIDLREIDTALLHKNIGVVFQETFLFAGTIYENIAYAKPDATPEEVVAAAKAANAHDFIMKTADGYDTLIGESGYTLSGGERQRISIARAILNNPDILILDEATSSLDLETEAAIQESLARLSKGRTTIAIAHRLSTLRSADRLAVLDKGRVVEAGTHVELLKKKGIYYDLVMAQRQTSRVAES